ncbi:MAG TPA: signal peptidase I [Pyrinomonadaceae bacterium]|nr:signal peptidase I [Pyrinomonadaceae bacterium]
MSREQRGAGVAEPPAEGETVRARAGGRDGGDASASAKDAAQKKHGPPHSVFREYFESLVVTAVMALFGMTFVVQAVKVPTGSMQNTILIGDHLLVNKFIFAPGPILPFLPQREIQRGDIIVFKYPGKYPSEQFQSKHVSDTVPFKTNYVKRVVGLPGDHVEVRGTDVYINGQPLPENKVAALNPPDADDPDTSGDERGAPLTDEQNAPLVGGHAPVPSGESTYNVYWKPENLREQRRVTRGEVFDVPEGHYFVMGDNRDNSEDSRYWGFVPRDLVIGRAMFVYWSYDESAPSHGNFIFDFFQNTRWGRTGTLVK